MMTDVKDVNKKLKEALKNFKEAIALARGNMIIGTYVSGPLPEKKEKAPRKPRTKKIDENQIELPDLDKKG